MNKKKVIIALVILLVIIIAVVLLVSNSSKKVGLYYILDEDGTKKNNSESLHQTKSFEGLEFSEIELTEENNVTVVRAVVKNTSDTPTKSEVINLRFVNNDKTELGTISWLAPDLYPGDSTQLATSSESQVVNAYDFTIYK